MIVNVLVERAVVRGGDGEKGWGGVEYKVGG